jgi:hypothetical protein
LYDKTKFPIAAANGFGNKNPDLSPDDDRITSKPGALQFFQLAIPAPTPRPNIDFDNAAALRGDKRFEGKARCTQCHAEPLWTDAGWNLHSAAENVAIPDDAEAIWDKEYRDHLVASAAELMKAEFQPTAWQAFWGLTVEGKSGAESSRPSLQSAAQPRPQGIR